ncbi:unnamed protein product [Paramecium sonneborni]|uniref:Uncharacterized protein n=1 Tax=Paramecium sonneborni TaxID=65129 RepID=A0A8S1Q146_9CILI|nr:unnamed protein product [Paramecium sonneborni]
MYKLKLKILSQNMKKYNQNKFQFQILQLLLKMMILLNQLIQNLKQQKNMKKLNQSHFLKTYNDSLFSSSLIQEKSENAWFKIPRDLQEKPDNIENFVKDQVKYYLIQVEEVTQPLQQLYVINLKKIFSYYLHFVENMYYEQLFQMTQKTNNDFQMYKFCNQNC